MIRALKLPQRTIQLVSLGVIAIAALANTALAQEKDQSAEMAAYMEAATPGPHHKRIASRAGTWKTQSTMWMEPGQPPMETTGTATFKPLMDGRFMEEITTATMMGQPWEGRGIFGYDNSTKKHVGTWFDSFGTMMMSFEGTCDGTCNVITTQSTYFDPMAKSMKTMKTVSTAKGDDRALLELYDVAKDGTEVKMVEIKYTREPGVKGQAKR